MSVRREKQAKQGFFISGGVAPMEQFAWPALELLGLTLANLPLTRRKRSNLDLTLWMSEGTEGLTAALEYNTELFESTTVSHLLENVHTLLQAIVADPGRDLSAVPIRRIRAGGSVVNAGKEDKGCIDKTVSTFGSTGSTSARNASPTRKAIAR